MTTILSRWQQYIQGIGFVALLNTSTKSDVMIEITLTLWERTRRIERKSDIDGPWSENEFILTQWAQNQPLLEDLEPPVFIHKDPIITSFTGLTKKAECWMERASFSRIPSSKATTTTSVIKILQLTTKLCVCVFMFIKQGIPSKSFLCNAWYFPRERVWETHPKCRNTASQQEIDPERLSIITHVYLMLSECQCVWILLHWCCRERRSCNVHQPPEPIKALLLQQAPPTAEKQHTTDPYGDRENTQFWQTGEKWEYS